MKTPDIHSLGERLIDRYQDGGLSRRGLLRGIAALAGYYTLLGLPSVKAAENMTIRYDAYGGVGQKFFSDHVASVVAKKLSAQLNQGSFGSPEEFLAQVQTAKPGDYQFFECAPALSYLRFTSLGLGAQIDESKIPRLKTVLPQALAEYRKITPSGISAVPFYLSVVSIAYNTTKIQQKDAEAAGANLLIRPDLKQRIAGEDNYRTRIWYAALQTGQDPNNISDMAAIWAKIQESKRLALKYWSTAAEQTSLLSSGSVWTSDAWGVRVYSLRKIGAPIASFRPKGLYQGVGGVMALKGAPLSAYYELMDLALHPEVQQAAAIQMGSLPALRSDALTDPKSLEQVPGFDPTGKYEGIVSMDAFYWQKHSEDWQREYRRVVARA